MATMSLPLQAGSRGAALVVSPVDVDAVPLLKAGGWRRRRRRGTAGCAVVVRWRNAWWWTAGGRRINCGVKINGKGIKRCGKAERSGTADAPGCACRQLVCVATVVSVNGRSGSRGRRSPITRGATPHDGAVVRGNGRCRFR